MKKFFAWFLLASFVFFGVGPIAFAEEEAPEPVPATSVNFFIRAEGNVILDGAVTKSDSIEILDSTGTTRTLNPDSVLAYLASYDEANENFSLSTIEYYDSFDSLYLKCITYNGIAYCDNWQFVVSGTSVASGMDKTIIAQSDSVAVYFGQNHKLEFDKTEINLGESVKAEAKKYNYIDNSWQALAGVTVGVTEPNPLDPWSPIVLSEVPVDASGVASLDFEKVGNFDIGIKEDFYFPTYPIKVNEKPESYGGGGSLMLAPKEFDLEKALNFLKENKNIILENEMLLDWSILAFASQNTETALLKEKLLSLGEPEGGILTETLRRAMSILSLGENPYSFADRDYIASILKGFNGEWFGDEYLLNDDLFALLVLQNAGFTLEDEIIKNTLDFLIGKQLADGSIENSPDLTSVFLQVTYPYKDSADADLAIAISQAEDYLKKSQLANASWGDSVFSTSWVILASNMLGTEWMQNNNSPKNFLAMNQTGDGGMLEGATADRIWATAYAIPAVSGQNWQEILKDVSRPEVAQIPEILPEVSINETQEDIKTTGEVLGEEKYNFSEPMYFGKKSKEVEELQKLLQKLGYYKANSITGYFGELTKHAVMRFQSAQKIKIDGIVGPETRGELNKINA